MLLPSILGLLAVAHAAWAATPFHPAYAEAGDAAAVPVVFVHAFPLNQAMWSSQVEALGKSARAITFDVRGLGKSETDAPFTLEFVVDDLIGLLDQLKIDKAVVVGLSMGGFVALRAVERNPERFLGLVLADTKSEPDSDSSKLGRYKALRAIQDEGLPSYAESFLKNSFPASTIAAHPELFERVRNIALANTAAGVQAAVLALMSRTDTTPGLGEIRVPTLIIHGEKDAVIPVSAAQSLHEKIKRSKLVLISGAGHLSNLENPEAFNAALVRFVKGLN